MSTRAERLARIAHESLVSEIAEKQTIPVQALEYLIESLDIKYSADGSCFSVNGRLVGPAWTCAARPLVEYLGARQEGIELYGLNLAAMADAGDRN